MTQAIAEFKDLRPDYRVTKLGSQNYVNGALRSPGAVIKTTDDNARFYLEMGWVEPVEMPKRRTSKKDATEVHDD